VLTVALFSVIRSVAEEHTSCSSRKRCGLHAPVIGLLDVQGHGWG